ncbi:HU domain-containing protein [Xanthocytophaga flava]|uniref:HU domain-containing protein n=1 Tax=Xanthocytophaga flava TaxID=3048013 RepID=UPI0028D4D08C|nr:hypothetical protein [Xanthocytophaga flavus]MDJ1472216.1 hypothetical protein [Xanthocytophaga flavus]
MMIEKYIRQLLFANDCVVIPDFGGFISKYAPATVHPVRHKFMPPSKEIAFNEMLRLNDGLLISHVAVGENVSREQATKLVKDFSDYVRQQIWQNQKYVFDEIGTLSLNPEQKMEFEPINRINYLNAGYGLPEMDFKPIERRTYQPKTRTKDRQPVSYTEETTEGNSKISILRRNKALWYVLGFCTLVALSAFTGYFILVQTGKHNLSTLSPFSTFNKHAKDSVAQAGNNVQSQSQSDSGTTQFPVNTDTATRPMTDWDDTREISTSENAIKSFQEEDSVTEPITTEEKKTISTKSTNNLTENTTKPAPKTVAAVRYYVIVNGFSVSGNADRFRDALMRTGYKHAKVLARGANGLLKVSVADFSNSIDAESKAQEMRKEYPAAWVYEE